MLFENFILEENHAVYFETARYELYSFETFSKNYLILTRESQACKFSIFRLNLVSNIMLSTPLCGELNTGV